MRIKLDENLPERLVAELAALGRGVDKVRFKRAIVGRDEEAAAPLIDSFCCKKRPKASH